MTELKTLQWLADNNETISIRVVEVGEDDFIMSLVSEYHGCPFSVDDPTIQAFLQEFLAPAATSLKQEIENDT